MCAHGARRPQVGGRCHSMLGSWHFTVLPSVRPLRHIELLCSIGLGGLICSSILGFSISQSAWDKANRQ